MTALMEQPATLVPTGRYEWERIVRRIVMPPQHKLAALLLATWADPDGSRVRPGIPLLAAAMGRGERTAADVVRSLCRDWGLIEQTSRGGGRGRSGRTADYRLTIPSDLLDRCHLLGPTGLPDPPEAWSASQSDDPPATTVAGQSPSSPVDNSDSPATQAATQSCQDTLIDRQYDAVTERLTGKKSRLTGNPALPTTTHITKPPTTNTPPGLPTQPPTARGTPEPQRPSPRRSTRCRHGLAAGATPDGTPRCPLCRRDPQDPP